MSQTDRKYDGPTIQERRLKAPPSPPPPRYRGVAAGGKKPSKGRIRVVDLYHWKFVRNGWNFWARYTSPFVGQLSYSRCTENGMHVLKRLRADVWGNEDIVWVEGQSTHEQLSPEFSNRECLLNWLEYEGFRRGYLQVCARNVERWDRVKREYRTERWVTIEKTDR
jgi:hypothetical protein